MNARRTWHCANCDVPIVPGDEYCLVPKSKKAHVVCPVFPAPLPEGHPLRGPRLELGVAMALGPDAVREAFGFVGYRPPTLYCHPSQFGYAREVARVLCINVGVDASLDPVHRWYLDFQGQQAGSVGC